MAAAHLLVNELTAHPDGLPSCHVRTTLLLYLIIEPKRHSLSASLTSGGPFPPPTRKPNFRDRETVPFPAGAMARACTANPVEVSAQVVRRLNWPAGGQGWGSGSRRLLVFFVGGLMGTCSNEVSSMMYSYEPMEKHLLPSAWPVAEPDPLIIYDVPLTFLNFPNFTVMTISSTGSSFPAPVSSLASISTDFLASYFPSSSPSASKCGATPAMDDFTSSKNEVKTNFYSYKGHLFFYTHYTHTK